VLIVDHESARRLMAKARVGVLGTVTPDGRPHVVPCCFVLAGGSIYSAVDAKPKTTLALRRLENLRTNAAASLLVHHYEEQWSELWWIRADGAGRVLALEDERTRAMRLLSAKYRQYRQTPPPGEVLVLDIEKVTSWP
jgi:PPOX class probable F420-dependent enzyme